MLKRSSNKFVEIPAGDLRIHPTAQRTMNPTKKRGLIENMDLDAIGTVHVVKRDRWYYVVDGQHRVSALVDLGYAGWPVRCEIHGTTTDSEASDLFLKLNNRASVGPYDRFANEVYAGDPIAVGAKSVVEAAGLRVNKVGQDGNVTCVATIKKIYQIDEGLTLHEVIDASLAAWGKRATAVEGKLLEGMAIVYSQFNGELDRDQLPKKLAKYSGGPGGLIGDARGISKMRGTPVAKAVAEQVLETYNRNRRGTRLELRR